MAEHAEGQAQSVTALELSGARALGLNLEVLEGHDAMGNEKSSRRIQKLGLALADFGGYIHPGRVQLLGGSEMSCLRILEPAVRSAAISRLHGQGISCIVVTKALEPPDDLLQLARRDRIPVLRTSALSSVFSTKISDYRDARPTGISLPLIEMAVAPGRTAATPVEVAARIQLLKDPGYTPSRELRRMVDTNSNRPAAENGDRGEVTG